MSAHTYKFKIKEREIELSHEEAMELFQDLSRVFGPSPRPMQVPIPYHLPTYPLIYFEPRPITFPPYTVTC